MQNKDVSPRQSRADEDARQIIRSALKASLATLESDTGFPYASLVTVGHAADGSSVLLLSDLAVHTRNLKADARASLLFIASDGAGDPLAAGRVTVIGRMVRVAGEAAAPLKARFLARQPAAVVYAGFSDFAFWRMEVEHGHYVGGFGRIVDLPAAQLLDDVSGASALIAAEGDIVTHMNDDHADAIGLYATRLGGAPKGDWRMTGIDPGGIDLVDGSRGVRLTFATRVTNPDVARAELVRMANAARAAGI
jgi:putative heme iron utilization protein